MRCTAQVETLGRTGVEMEALTAVQVGLLTVYDMCKAADRGMVIDEHARAGEARRQVGRLGRASHRGRLPKSRQSERRPAARTGTADARRPPARRARRTPAVGIAEFAQPRCARWRARSMSPCAASACAQAIIRRVSSR